MTTPEIFWKALTTPKNSNLQEAQQEYMTRVVLVMTLAVLVLFSIPIVIGWGLIRFDWESISVILVLNLIVVFVWLLAQCGYWRLGSYVPPTIFFLLAIYGTYFKGMLTAYLLFYVVAILLTFMLHGAKAQWIMLGFTIAFYLGCGWLQNPMHLSDEDRLTISITVCSSFIGVAMLIWFSTRELNRALNQVRGNAIDLQRYRDHLEQANKALQTQIHVAKALRTAYSPAEMLPVILNEVADLLNASGVVLGLRDQRSGELVIDHGTREGTSQIGRRLKFDEGICAIVMQTGSPYICNDTGHDPHISPPTNVASPIALAAIPLIAKEQSIGIMMVGRNEAFLDDDIYVLNAIGDMAANAIQRAILDEETQLRLQRLNTLHNIEKALTTNFEIETALDIVLDHLVTQLGIHASDILLYEPLNQTLTYVAGRGFRYNTLYHAALRIGKGFAGGVAIDRHTVYIPDLALANQGTEQTRQLITQEGFVSYFGVPLIAKGMVKGVLELYQRQPLEKDPEWTSFLETLARQIANAIDNSSLFEDLQRSNLELTLAYDTTLEGWAKALELRDKETEGHSQNVTELTLKLALEMGVKKKDLIHVRRGALLHDIGKMGVPDHILFKPGPLTDEEWQIMRQHPVYAYELLTSIGFLRPALDIPYYHHERWDGSGYPRGLKGEEIPLSARVFAVVDVWDALNSDRPYRKAWEREDAIKYIKEQAGKHFDPRVVESFLRSI